MYIADLHIHSRYSRATSKNITIESLSAAAKEKGINLLGTGDCLHPLWLDELELKLRPEAPGIFSFNGVNYILQTEISNIYTQGGKLRKIHTVLLFPDFDTVRKLQNKLSHYGSLTADGRPIFGLSLRDTIKIIIDINPDIMIIPAHIWTPWFSLFGSNSGFDSIEECCGEYKKYITALETGLSSDPPMNWMVSELDDYILVSNSDAHSTGNLGREANVFAEKLDYYQLKKVLESKDRKKFLYTIEFFPEEGKYHYDGHRNCNVSMHPEKAIEERNICPVCGNPLTIGVLHRVYDLADRPYGFRHEKAIPYKRLVPLKEIIAEVLKIGVSSKKVEQMRKILINSIGPEFYILLEAPIDDIIKYSGIEDMGLAVEAMRKEKVKIKPGFDGVFGEVKIDIESLKNQKSKKKEGGELTLF